MHMGPAPAAGSAFARALVSALALAGAGCNDDRTLSDPNAPQVVWHLLDVSADQTQVAWSLGPASCASCWDNPQSLHIAHPTADDPLSPGRQLDGVNLDFFLHAFTGDDFLYAITNDRLDRLGVDLLRPGWADPAPVIRGDVGAGFWPGFGGAPGFGLTFHRDPKPTIDAGSGDVDGGSGDPIEDLLGGFLPTPGQMNLIRLGECKPAGCAIHELADGVDVGSFAVASDTSHVLLAAVSAAVMAYRFDWFVVDVASGARTPLGRFTVPATQGGTPYTTVFWPPASTNAANFTGTLAAFPLDSDDGSPGWQIRVVDLIHGVLVPDLRIPAEATWPSPAPLAGVWPPKCAFVDDDTLVAGSRTAINTLGPVVRATRAGVERVGMPEGTVAWEVPVGATRHLMPRVPSPRLDPTDDSLTQELYDIDLLDESGAWRDPAKARLLASRYLPYIGDPARGPDQSLMALADQGVTGGGAWIANLYRIDLRTGRRALVRAGYRGEMWSTAYDNRSPATVLSDGRVLFLDWDDDDRRIVAPLHEWQKGHLFDGRLTLFDGTLHPLRGRVIRFLAREAPATAWYEFNASTSANPGVRLARIGRTVLP